MRGTWSNLALLLVVPWLTGCVSGPRIRLDTGQGAPLLYTPPAHQPAPVELLQEGLVSGLTDLLLHMPLAVDAPRWEGRIRLASWDGGARDDAVQRLMERQCPHSEPADGCLMLPANAPPPETLARMRLALSFAMDTVWEGAAVPISEHLDPLVFKIMVCTAMSTYLLLLMVPIPEPVTKGVAAALTLYLVAYLGLGPVWAMVQAAGVLLEESRRATTAEALKEVGHRFGRVLGDSGMRVLLLLVTAALSGQAGLVSRGPGLPSFGQAALASRVRTRVALEAAGQVRSVTLGVKEVVVVLAPTAVAVAAMGPSGAPPTTDRQTGEPGGGKGAAREPGAGVEPVNAGRWHEGSYGSPMKSLQEHFAKHGAEVGATDAAQYLRKAEAFAQNLRGAQRFPVEGFTEGVVRYVKNGRYIDLALDGRIVSFGTR